MCNSGTISSDKTSFNKNSRLLVWNVIQTQLHNNLNIMKFGEENNTKQTSVLSQIRRHILLSLKYWLHRR